MSLNSPHRTNDPESNQSLVRSLHRIRDVLSHRVEHLSTAVDQLRDQAGQLHTTLADGTMDDERRRAAVGAIDDADLAMHRFRDSMRSLRPAERDVPSTSEHVLNIERNYTHEWTPGTTSALSERSSRRPIPPGRRLRPDQPLHGPPVTFVIPSGVIPDISPPSIVRGNPSRAVNADAAQHPDPPAGSIPSTRPGPWEAMLTGLASSLNDLAHDPAVQNQNIIANDGNPPPNDLEAQIADATNLVRRLRGESRSRALETTGEWTDAEGRNGGGECLRRNRMPPSEYTLKKGWSGCKPTNMTSMSRPPFPEIVRSAPSSPAMISPIQVSDEDTTTTSAAPTTSSPLRNSITPRQEQTLERERTTTPRARQYIDEYATARNPDQALTTRGLRLAARLQSRSATPTADAPVDDPSTRNVPTTLRALNLGNTTPARTQTDERATVFRNIARDIIDSHDATAQRDGASRASRRTRGQQIRALAEAMNRTEVALDRGFLQVDVTVDVSGEQPSSSVRVNPSANAVRSSEPAPTATNGSSRHAVDHRRVSSRPAESLEAPTVPHMQLQHPELTDTHGTLLTPEAVRNSERATRARRRTQGIETRPPPPVEGDTGLSRWRTEQLRAAGAARQRVAYINDLAPPQNPAPGSGMLNTARAEYLAIQSSDNPEITTLRDNVRELMRLASEMESHLHVARQELDAVMARRREVVSGRGGVSTARHMSDIAPSTRAESHLGNEQEGAEVRRRRRQRGMDGGDVDLVETLRVAELGDNAPRTERREADSAERLDNLLVDVRFPTVNVQEVVVEDGGLTVALSGSETERENVEEVTGGTGDAVLEGSGEADPSPSDDRVVAPTPSTSTSIMGAPASENTLDANLWAAPLMPRRYERRYVSMCDL